jgi:preprotein translocase subunit SecD
MFNESPVLTSPEGDHPPGLDPETGLTVVDDPTVAAYLPSGSDPLVVYHLAPAVVAGSDFEGGEARSFTGPFGVDWAIDPQFTAEGAEKFRQASMVLASEPFDSPTRQIAIVFDGTVISAPAIAHETDPLVGLDPGEVVFFVGGSDNSQRIAEEIAATLQQ